MQLSTLGALAEELQTLLTEFDKARTKASQSDWDQLVDGPLGKVLDSISELEDLAS